MENLNIRSTFLCSQCSTLRREFDAISHPNIRIIIGGSSLRSSRDAHGTCLQRSNTKGLRRLDDCAMRVKTGFWKIRNHLISLL